jgi:hypothetical protein
MDKYAVLMFAVPAHTRAMSEAALDVVVRKHATFRDELTASGELIGGAGLVLPDETLALRLGPSGVVTQQGPLATDAVEHLTAYYEIECDSVERAEEIAARVLDDHVVAVELRRIHDTA